MLDIYIISFYGVMTSTYKQQVQLDKYSSSKKYRLMVNIYVTYLFIPNSR